MKRVLWRVAALAIAAIAAPADVRAQAISSPYRFVEESQSVGLMGGYVWTDPGRVDLGPRSAPLLGARYSIRVNGPFTAEGEAALLRTSRLVRDTIPEGETAIPTLGEADLSLLLLSAALRFNLTGPRTWRGIMPFLVAGGGAAIRVSSDEALDEQLEPDARYRFGTSFAGQLGGGIEWFAMRNVTVRADARNVLWKVAIPDAFRIQDPGLPGDEWTQNFSLTIGASYRF